jgi:serralysin
MGGAYLHSHGRRISVPAAPADTVLLENLVMTARGATGALNANLRFAGAAARDADDRIIYNNATGALLHDANGTAAGGVTTLRR